jgi:glycosyltransferase involved in cell wall biosynthesis
MRIALNLMYVGSGVAGGRVYAEGLLRGLARVDPENEYVAFTRRGLRLPELPPGRFRQHAAPVSDASTLWRTAWEYGALPRHVRRGSFAVFHGLGNVSPLARPCPLVLTVHDVLCRHYPQSLPLGYRLFLQAVLPAVARRADRVIVLSRAMAEEVVRHLGVAEGRLRLVRPGPGHELGRVTDGEAVGAVLGKYGVRRPFVVSVCRGYFHKNLAGLLRAFAVVRRRRPDVQLVLAGRREGGGPALDRLLARLGLQGAVVFTGFVANADLQVLYSAAAVFAFPSLYEGFGLPVLEAMACGAPVVASDAAAVPEAVGPAGLLADAGDSEAFAAALARVLSDEGVQEEYRRRGLEWVKGFTWDRCAAETLAVYRELGGP